MLVCGYVGNLHECPEVLRLLLDLGVKLPIPKGQFYPRRVMDGILIQNSAGFEFTPAIWWYALRREGNTWSYNDKVTSFNARNLQSPMWQEAVKYRRAIVVASEIGESEGKLHYLMRSRGGLLLAALYKEWKLPEGDIARSFAIITRPAHSRLAHFHKKSTPCFLPFDHEKIRCWLDPSVQQSSVIDEMLFAGRLYCDLEVTPVKTFKRAEIVGSMHKVQADLF